MNWRRRTLACALLTIFIVAGMSCVMGQRPVTTADAMVRGVLNAACDLATNPRGADAATTFGHRFDVLMDDSSPEADEAVVVLLGYYLGEAYDEDVWDNVVGRGPRVLTYLRSYQKARPATTGVRCDEPIRLSPAVGAAKVDRAISAITTSKSTQSAP